MNVGGPDGMTGNVAGDPHFWRDARAVATIAGHHPVDFFTLLGLTSSVNMPQKTAAIVPLCDLAPNQEADFFALLSAKEELATRDNKPYFKITFRDGRRAVTTPIWSDSAWAAECRDGWQAGEFYKLRAAYRESNYGPQLEIKKIRAVVESDAADGFDPLMCLEQSRFSAEQMFDELVMLAEERITSVPLRSLVVEILRDNRETLLTLPAATKNHHAYVGGYLEHVLSVTKSCVYFADKYDEYYPNMQPRLDKGLVVAGAILHDIGKLREIEQQSGGAAYTASGALLGHMVQGRDIVREAAARLNASSSVAGQDGAVGTQPLDAETLLRLEHIIISHQRLPEWGSPKPPMTPEALIVHFTDDLDAKYNMMYRVLRDNAEPGPVTSKKNLLYQQVYKGVGTT
jgi:3'-5' exoribonuclease